MKKITLTRSEIKDLVDLYQTEIDRAQRRIESLKSILNKIEKGDLGEENESAPEKRGRKPKAVKATEPAMPKKKRGRPRKVTDEKTQATEVKEPKKRGRKPKAKPENALETTKKTSQKVTKNKVKTSIPKKRGRKPKSLHKSLKQEIGGEKVKWANLIIDVFKSNNRLLQSKDLAFEVLQKLQLPEDEMNRTRMAVATNLTKLTKYDNKIRKYSREGEKIGYYGLAEWFNEDGSLKSEYQNKF